MYVAVKGGEKAIANAHKLLADRRRDLISAFLAGAGAGARALLPGSRRRRGVAPRR